MYNRIFKKNCRFNLNKMDDICCVVKNWKNPETSALAAEKGHLKCLKKAYQNKCKWNHFTPSNAAKNGNLSCLEFAFKNKCPWNKNTTFEAVKNKQIECFKFAFENGCETEDLLEFACCIGNLDYLKYIHSKGYIKTTGNKALYWAAKKNQIECLKFLLNNNYQWNYEWDFKYIPMECKYLITESINSHNTSNDQEDNVILIN